MSRKKGDVKKQYLTCIEAAALLGVSGRRVRQLCKAGILKYDTAMPGGIYLIDPDSIRAGQNRARPGDHLRKNKVRA